MALFGRRKIRVAAPSAGTAADMGAADEREPALAAAVNAWFAAFQKPIFDKRWAQLVACLFAAVAIGEAFALTQLIPLKEKVPEFVDHDERTGAVWLSNRTAEKYSPTTANKTYFLKIWAHRLLTIQNDPQITMQSDIPLAEGWTTGSAIKQVETWVLETDRTADRIAQTPGLTRTFTENSTSYSADGQTAYMVVTLQESVQGTPSPPVQRLLTIGVAFLPSKLRDGEENDNPLGTRITSFSNTPYIGPGSTR